MKNMIVSRPAMKFWPMMISGVDYTHIHVTTAELGIVSGPMPTKVKFKDFTCKLSISMSQRSDIDTR